MAAVVETAWQPGRSAHGGHVEFQVKEYWSLGGKRGGTGIRMVGVRGRTGEPYSGGAAGKFQMTVYWHRGVYAAVLGTVWWGYAAVLEGRTVGALRGCMAVLGCPPDPSNNSGGARGHPLAPLTN